MHAVFFAGRETVPLKKMDAEVIGLPMFSY
jgi:hypothetical protein